MNSHGFLCELPPVVEIPTSTALSGLVPSLNDLSDQIVWCRHVIRLAERTQQGLGLPLEGDAHLLFRTTDPILQRIIGPAVDIVLEICMTATIQEILAEALFLQAKLKNSGIFREYLPENRREAFESFKAAADRGYHAAWFNLGVNYEEKADIEYAMRCYECGHTFDEPSCTYVCAFSSVTLPLRFIKYSLAARYCLHIRSA